MDWMLVHNKVAKHILYVWDDGNGMVETYSGLEP